MIMVDLICNRFFDVSKVLKILKRFVLMLQFDVEYCAKATLEFRREYIFDLLYIFCCFLLF